MRRATINECVSISIRRYVEIHVDTCLEMGAMRERGASLNRSGVECGIRKAEMCNGMFHKVLQSGAALLKAIVRV